MLSKSKSLRVADADVAIARHEQGKARALWWPHVQANGLYAHLSERVEVRQPLSRFTDPAKDYVQRIFPSEQLITGLLDRVGEHTLSFPLLPLLPLPLSLSFPLLSSLPLLPSLSFPHP